MSPSDRSQATSGLDDAPVTKVSDDHYELARAAYHLARIVSQLVDQERAGQVIAANARWGGGKTSLVNLTEPLFTEDFSRMSLEETTRWRPARYPEADFSREIGSFYSKNVKFIHFNAWLDGGEKGVAIAIVDAIADALAGDAGPAQNLARRLWRDARNNPEGYVKAGLGLAGAGAAILGHKLDTKLDFKSERKVLKEVERLAKAIEDKQANVVVVIDDIDRMPPDRIQALIVALWWVKDLPRVNFLLLFDREQVVDSLARTMFHSMGNEAGQQSAARFLEKIVQYSFEVPQPPRQNLLAELEKKLRGICGDDMTKLPGTFRGVRRWEAIRRYVLRDLVNTARAVKRLVWTVEKSWPMRKYIGIDFRDLVAVEAVRLFHPKLFAELEDIQGRLERGLPLSENWNASLPDAAAKAVLLPSYFLDGDAPLEVLQSVRTRRGVGLPQLMSHYLQGVPNPNISVLYNSQEFFAEEYGAFRATLWQATKDGKLGALCAHIHEELLDRAQTDVTIETLVTQLQRAAETLAAEPASDKEQQAKWIAELNSQSKLMRE